MYKSIKWSAFSFALALFAVIGLLPMGLSAQPGGQLSLDEAYRLARENYPLIRQKELISKSAGLTIDNLKKGFLPQVSVLGQATYQSDVTEIKIPFPGFTVEPLSKDQYKLVTDVSQMVYDGGITREQKNLQQLNASVEQQKLEVDLYKLNERISQFFLGILFLEEQLKQVELVKIDINNGIKKVEAQVNNGVAFRSGVTLLQAELLKTEQRVIEINASRTGLLQALSLFINQKLPMGIRLITPVVLPVDVSSTAIARPEIQLFTTQDKYLDGQAKLVDAKILPRASVFMQSGYGRPGLNFLKNDFAFYYIGGVRLNWSLGGLYTQKKDKELLQVNRRMVDIQAETFLLNTRTAMVQQQAEVEKLQQLIASDNDIIELRAKVKEAAKAQLDNGVITANDYLREVTAEDLARQTMITHQLQLLQARVNLKNITGNQ